MADINSAKHHIAALLCVLRLDRNAYRAGTFERQRLETLVKMAERIENALGMEHTR